MAINTKFQLVVVALIVKNDKILVGKKRASISHLLTGKWVFPGGTVKEKESYLETAFREIREETNIDRSHLDFERIIGMSERRRQREGQTEFITTLWLLFNATKNAMAKGGDDLKETKWIPKSEVINFFHPLAFERLPGAVVEYLTSLNKTK